MYLARAHHTLNFAHTPTVYIICSDSNSVKSYLQQYNIPLYNLEFLITNFNSIWVRDYGPWTAYTNDFDTLNIIDWIYNRPRPLDDVTPVFFANYISAPIYQTTTPPYNLTHAGGNLMVDGHGTAFSSKLILNENSFCSLGLKGIPNGF